MTTKTIKTTMTIKPPDSKLDGTYDNLAVQERQLYVDGVCVGACARWIMENYPCLVLSQEWRNRPWGHFPHVALGTKHTGDCEKAAKAGKEAE